MSKDSPTSTPIAHVSEDGRIHPLIDHLREVGRLAGQFANVFGSSSWAELAGLWHDLGKYSKAFQDMIRSASGLDAHIETAPGRVDHSTAGALHAVQKLGPYGNILAYLIAGHHAGLPDWNSEEEGRASLYQRLQKPELLETVLKQLPPKELLEQEKPSSKPPGGAPALWIRMLFSCLTDGDFLDTEAFMDPGKAKARSNYPALAELATRFDVHIKRLVATADPTPVNRLRAEILRECEDKSHHSPAILSLTVPTGGGKTLSSLAFALRHAIKYGKRRVIYVIPYTSIIEQTADIFREIFGDAVIEHHSNLDPEKETPQSRLACENWDAPVVVTTSVQFFESLFASRTSRTRKLHNIVDSVVILDEAQLLPPEFLKPVVEVMRDLQRFYGVTFVLSTATQPALTERKGFDFHFPGFPEVVEIIDDPVKLHGDLKRVEVVIPNDLNTPRTWEDIATELRYYPSALCIVNRRDDCRDLFRLMPSGTIHLSALMCGEHRSAVISNIRYRLKRHESLRVVSTQLVEAGVDLDFPVVYRALAGLDSIAQAAGRCNREGLLDRGKVVIFVPPKPAPVGTLRQAEGCGRQLLQQRVNDPLAPERFEEYFRQLYWLKGENLDKHRILEDLKANDQLHIRFRSAAKKFRIIDDTVQQSIIVRYGQSVSLIEQLGRDGPERWLMRKLQRYVVNIPKVVHQRLVSDGDVIEIRPGIFAQAHDRLYHPELGFLANDPTYRDPETLIV
jgi:CRISPR-associated endonuclease/helicase Cas3